MVCSSFFLSLVSDAVLVSRAKLNIAILSFSFNGLHRAAKLFQYNKWYSPYLFGRMDDVIPLEFYNQLFRSVMEGPTEDFSHIGQSGFNFIQLFIDSSPLFHRPHASRKRSFLNFLQASAASLTLSGLFLILLINSAVKMKSFFVVMVLQ